MHFSHVSLRAGVHGCVLAFACMFLWSGNAVATTVPVDSTLWKQADSLHKSRSCVQLVEALTSNLDQEEDAALSIYYWMIQHSELKLDLLPKPEKKPLSPDQLLHKKSLTAAQLARLAAHLMETAGLKATVVEGYRKNEHSRLDTILRVNHYWNAVQINREWKLFDVSQGIGFGMPKERPLQQFLYSTFGKAYVCKKMVLVHEPNPEFFAPKPAELAQTHLPANPMWQLLDHPLPVPEFRKHDQDVAHYLRMQELKPGYSIDCYKEIRNHLTEMPAERSLQAAMQAHRFYPENVSIKARGHSLYGLEKLHEMNSTVSSDTGMLAHGLRSATDHLKVALDHYVAEKKSLKGEHKDLLNRNKHIHKGLAKETKGMTSALTKIQKTNSRHTQKLQSEARKLAQNIFSLELANDQLDDEAIKEVSRRPGNSPEENAAVIADHQAEIKLLLKTVDDNGTVSQNLIDDMAFSRSEISSNQQALEANSTDIRTLLNTSTMIRIRNFDQRWRELDWQADQIASQVQLKRALHLDNKLEETLVILPELKQLQKLQNGNVKHLKDICKRLTKIKKLNVEGNEDRRYSVQIEAIAIQNDFMIDQLEQRLIQIRLEISFNKKENKLIEQEKKDFAQAVKVDGARSRWASRFEQKRYKRAIKQNVLHTQEVKQALRQASTSMRDLKTADAGGSNIQASR